MFDQGSLRGIGNFSLPFAVGSHLKEVGVGNELSTSV